MAKERRGESEEREGGYPRYRKSSLVPSTYQLKRLWRIPAVQVIFASPFVIFANFSQTNS